MKERHFREGTVVKKGQLLLVIDEVPFQVQLDQAKARLAEAEASLRKSKESRSREVARAQLALDDSQLQLARLAEARQRNLTSRNAGSREELDQAEANRKKSEAQVQATRANLDQVEADYVTNILGYEANVASARTAVRNAEIELGYCRMYAPIDGRISRVNLHVDNLVGDTQSSLLATIVKIDSVYAYVNVSEYDLLRYRNNSNSPGQPVAGPESMPMELGLANEQGYPHRGQGDYQDPCRRPGNRDNPRPRCFSQSGRRDPARDVRSHPRSLRKAERVDSGPGARPEHRPVRSVSPRRGSKRCRGVSPGQGGLAVRWSAGC